MRINRVWKVVAVVLLYTGQMLCTSAAIYEVQLEPSTSSATLQELKRGRRALIGVGGGGQKASIPPTPLSVKQNPITPTEGFSLTIHFYRNSLSIISPNFKMVEEPPSTTSPPKTVRKLPTTIKSPPKILQTTTTIKPTPKILQTTTTVKPTTIFETTTNTSGISHFRKLNKPKKAKVVDEAVPSTNDEEVPLAQEDNAMADVDPVLMDPETTTAPINADEFFVPVGGIQDEPIVIEPMTRMESPTDSGPSPLAKTILARDFIAKGPRTMKGLRTLIKAKKKGKN